MNMNFLLLNIMILNGPIILYIECDDRYPQSIDIYNVILNKFINSIHTKQSIKDTLKKWLHVPSKHRNHWFLSHDLNDEELRELKVMIFKQLKTFYLEDLIQYGSII
tara:strand:+ start:577 stop:897 length:321 start_codon:yes stop_codon:yes gene_type:complete